MLWGTGTAAVGTRSREAEQLWGCRRCAGVRGLAVHVSPARATTERCRLGKPSGKDVWA